MGNTALTEKFGFVGERLSDAEYHQCIEELTEKSKSIFDNFQHVLSYENKDSHGDIDCAAVCTASDSVIQEAIKLHFGARYVRKNSYVYSFDYKGKYQIDLAILPDASSLRAHMFYCNYSPVGNVMGRILKQTGLKLGTNGLTYPIKLSDAECLGEVVIFDPFTAASEQRILEFFGSSRLYGNFKDQEDIFRFLAESRFFNGTIFQFENLNHVNRKRDSKRGDYHAWPEYIKDRPDTFQGDPNKKVYLGFLERFFNRDITEQWKNLYGSYLIVKDNNSKFNGDMVMELTGKTGKDLGLLIKDYKQTFLGDTNFNKYLLTHTAPEVKEHFLNWTNESTNL